MRGAVLLFLFSAVMGGVAMGNESIYPQTPVGKIEVKEIPARTGLASGAEGDPFLNRDRAFSRLFNYIKHNDVAMTVPVEASATSNTMIFFVGEADADKELESDDKVSVKRLEPIRVLSIGMRGAYTRELYEEGLRQLKAWLSQHPEWQAEGEPYGVYWSSPFVLGFLKRSEVHQPIRKSEGEAEDPRVAVEPGTSVAQD